MQQLDTGVRPEHREFSGQCVLCSAPFPCPAEERRRASEFDGRPAADALYWLLHDGNEVLLKQPRIHGLVMAAGILGELVLTAKVKLWAGGALGIVPGQRPDDSTAEVLEAIRRADAPDYDLRRWVEAVAGVAVATVEVRLLARGELRQVAPTPRRWRAPAPTRRCEPVDRQSAARPWAVLQTRLDRPEGTHSYDVDAEGLNLAGRYLLSLLIVAGLSDHLSLGHLSDAARRRVRRWRTGLPGDLGQLVDATETAIASGVMSYRT